MPLLGATGNASEYSFRGTYDNYPLDIDFGDLVDVEPGKIYKTRLKTVDGINYKVPISISGDGEYYVGDITFNETFDNNQIRFDQTDITFDSDFPELNYDTIPTYVRSGDSIAIRVIGAEPGTEITSEYYGKTYSTIVTIGKRDFTWTVETQNGGRAENLFFDDVNDVEFSTEVISNTYEVKGLTDAFVYTVEITSNEGLLSINYGEFTNSAIVKNGDILRLKVNSSSLNFTQKTVAVRIFLNASPDIQSTAFWNVKTLDNVPSNLSFTDILSAELNSEILSEIITINGISNNIDFDIAITSPDGLLSVNGGLFVKSTTIRNGNTIELKLNTTGNWLEEKIVTVQLEDTSTNWKVTNRTIEPNSDLNADKLIYAIPFNTLTQIQDVSPEVRLKSFLPQGLRATTKYGSYSGATDPSISREQSKYYDIEGSLKLAKGTTTRQFEVSRVEINTDQTQVLGYNDFTIEMWMRFTGFDFGGENGMSIFYPSYIDTQNSSDYFLQLYLKGDNWPNVSRYRRGLWLGFPNYTTGTVEFLTETTSQVLVTNKWHHIALTRSGSLFTIWVDGINRTSGRISRDLTSTSYNFALPNFQRLIPDDIYIQDLRLYKGFTKYTSNFDPLSLTTVNSIMETSPNANLATEELVTWSVTREARLDNTITFVLESGNGPSSITFGPNAGTVSTYIQIGSVYTLQNNTGTIRLSGNTLQLEDSPDIVTDIDYNDLTVTPNKGVFTSFDRYVFE